MATPGYPAQLAAGAVLLRPPRRRDAAAWSEIRQRNERWLAPWEPTTTGTWSLRNDRMAWGPVCSALRRAGRAGTMLPFVVTYNGRFAGQITVSNVVFGALRSCTVGYWVDGALAGRGITPTALALLGDHCFGVVGMHRIEVDIRPENAASLRVVDKLGFRREGFYERFLDIDGGWRDHVAFALTIEDLAGGTLMARLPGVPPPS